MKKTILLLLALIGWGVVQAQTTDQITATLQNGDNTTIFYGIDALKSAVAAAPETGGVITLSSGIFNNPGALTKSLRIYGVGFEQDTVANIAPTSWKGELEIRSSAEGQAPHNLHIEGCKIESNISTPNEELKGLKVVKCAFGHFDQRGPLTNAIIRQCYISGAYQANQKTCNNITIQNTILYTLGGIPTDNTLVVNHCILLVGAVYDAHWNSLPPIVYYNSYLSRLPASGGHAINCVLREAQENEQVTYSDCWFGVTPDAAYGVSSSNGRWDNGTITYQPQYTWQLNDPQQQYIATDGTPVGVHGGQYPWEKTPCVPRIVESQVARQANADNLLHVSLKAEARPATE